MIPIMRMRNDPDPLWWSLSYLAAAAVCAWEALAAAAGASAPSPGAGLPVQRPPWAVHLAAASLMLFTASPSVQSLLSSFDGGWKSAVERGEGRAARPLAVPVQPPPPTTPAPYTHTHAGRGPPTTPWPPPVNPQRRSERWRVPQLFVFGCCLFRLAQPLAAAGGTAHSSP